MSLPTSARNMYKQSCSVLTLKSFHFPCRLCELKGTHFSFIVEKMSSVSKVDLAYNEKVHSISFPLNI